MKIDDKLVDRIAKDLKVDFTKIPKSELKRGIDVETEHKDVIDTNNSNSYPDYVKYAKIALDHLRESPNYYKELDKMESKLTKENIIKTFITVLKESLKEPDFKNKLKYEISKNDTGYNTAYLKALGKYKVDTPDQLDDKTKSEFYDYLDSLLQENVEGNISGFNTPMMSVQKRSIAGINEDDDIETDSGDSNTQVEVAPPGREKQVKALKKEFPNDKEAPFKIAWSQEKKEKKKDETAFNYPDYGTPYGAVGQKSNPTTKIKGIRHAST